MFVGMFERADLREYFVGRGGAAHTHDRIVVGRMCQVGPAEAVESFALGGGYRDGDDQLAEAVDAVFSVVGIIEGLPEGIDRLCGERRPEIGWFAAGEDMAPGVINGRREAQDPVFAGLEDDVAAGSASKPFILSGIAAGGLRSVDDEDADAVPGLTEGADIEAGKEEQADRGLHRIGFE